jgi:methyl-accepting chemotaxis protein
MLKKLQSNLTNLKLGQQVSFLMLIIFLMTIAASGITLDKILNYNIQNQVSSKALILMEAMDSLRSYSNTQVFPELSNLLEERFLPQAIPSYSVREVFEGMRANPNYKDFFYKDAMLNPTNLRDKADRFEKTIVDRFAGDTNLKELRGFRSSSGDDLFYIARPLIIKKPNCLQCHTTPDMAPKSQIDRYGSENGFGWELNKVLGAQMIFVPASEIINLARRSFWVLMAIILLFFGVAIFLVNFWLSKFVVRPINSIAKVAEAVSIGDMEAKFGRQSNDEVGKLAESFRRMQTSLQLAMTRIQRNRNSTIRKPE